ncbi:NUDIX domain-containing protein [Streptomyces sp. NRRL S-1521]|uniref:NUDIX domain-containing protein n=1 Tax=Streptomyces sp. NRRL S-1521 TaxID=1609100 RepID=UPI001F167A93|nr:NUDIX domain-containing protein [Streptomyces sp. NRRL S-1521]
MRSLLGGGRETQDTTLEHTVRRELVEEAGLDLADLSPFGTEYASHDDPAGTCRHRRSHPTPRARPWT